MNRREVLALAAAVTAAGAAVPRGAGAQPQPRHIPRVGIIDNGTIWNPFRQALNDGGFVEAKTIAYEYRAAGGVPDRLAAAATELVRLPVDLIAAYGTPASRAAKAATSTIPIVMISVGDPVRAGLVESLAHPGGNVTGNTILAADLSAKRLHLIKEILPSVTRIALLWNPNNLSNAVILENLRSTAPALGMTVTAVEARSSNEITAAFDTLARERPDVVMFTNDPLHQSHIQKIISFLFQRGLPSVFQTRDNVAVGGLMSYGPSFPELFRQGGSYAQKILQGAKPADLPVQTPQHLQLAINLKTAKAIGLKISEAVLSRADEVIE